MKVLNQHQPTWDKTALAWDQARSIGAVSMKDYFDLYTTDPSKNIKLSDIDRDLLDF
jgi:hypothetical protein